jgi:hypothetical protein
MQQTTVHCAAPPAGLPNFGKTSATFCYCHQVICIVLGCSSQAGSSNSSSSSSSKFELAWTPKPHVLACNEYFTCQQSYCIRCFLFVLSQGGQAVVSGSYERQPITSKQLDSLKQLVEQDRLDGHPLLCNDALQPLLPDMLSSHCANQQNG